MSLEQDVRDVLTRLLSTGWREMFAKHGVSEQTEFSTVLNVDMTVPGFHDFSRASAALVHPGDPARSLLYHSLASPAVRPLGVTRESYPTQDCLDLIENYIYSLTTTSEQQRKELVPVVFAYEYREAAGTPHRMHADMVFSRTGIARVGNIEALYEPRERTYRPDASAPHEVRVMPARYAVFLCECLTGDKLEGGCLGGLQLGDHQRKFFVPMVKVFSGLKLGGVTYDNVKLSSYHMTDRIRRLFSVGKLRNVSQVDLDNPPYTRTTLNGGLLINDDVRGASLVVYSQPQSLVREVLGSLGVARRGITEVPARGPGIEAYYENRRYSTLRVGQKIFTAGLDYIASALVGAVAAEKGVFLSPRNCPEFINMRHRLDSETGRVDDINISVEKPAAFESLLDAGRYNIALYQDDICDGYVSATYRLEMQEFSVIPAFSVITAPDFFPCLGNLELKKFAGNFKEGGPSALCEGRLGANARMKYPDTDATVFTSDGTLVAVISKLPRSQLEVHTRRTIDVPTALSDGASNVFAPGWDVTYGRDGLFSPPYYHTAGLGSPFVEDAKLCAAANGMWAAASPDASRTFNRAKTPTAIPLTDEELGIHPESPGGIHYLPNFGWDGEHGPFLMESDEGLMVNFSDIMRADYVSNALFNRMNFDKLHAVGSEEMQSRLHALVLAVERLDGAGAKVSDSSRWLVVFRCFKLWSDLRVEEFLSPSMTNIYARAQADIQKIPGGGYIFGFAEGVQLPQYTHDPKRLSVAVSDIRLLLWDRNKNEVMMVSVS